MAVLSGMVDGLSSLVENIMVLESLKPVRRTKGIIAKTFKGHSQTQVHRHLYGRKATGERVMGSIMDMELGHWQTRG